MRKGRKAGGSLFFFFFKPFFIWFVIHCFSVVALLMYADDIGSKGGLVVKCEPNWVECFTVKLFRSVVSYCFYASPVQSSHQLVWACYPVIQFHWSGLAILGCNTLRHMCILNLDQWYAHNKWFSEYQLLNNLSFHQLPVVHLWQLFWSVTHLKCPRTNCIWLYYKLQLEGEHWC